MTLARFRTDYRLWILTSASVFIVLGFVDPVAGMAKGDNSLWDWVGILFRREPTNNMLVPTILFRSVFQAIPAVLVGWVMQAPIVMVRSSYSAKHSS